MKIVGDINKIHGQDNVQDIRKKKDVKGAEKFDEILKTMPWLQASDETDGERTRLAGKRGRRIRSESVGIDTVGDHVDFLGRAAQRLHGFFHAIRHSDDR